MKTQLIMAIVFTAVGGPIFAEGTSTGYLQLGLDRVTFDYPDRSWDDEYNPWIGFSLEAALTYGLSANRSMTVEARSFSVSDATEEYGVSQSLAAVHLNWDFANFTAGGFLGLMAASEYYNMHNDDMNYFIGGSGKSWVSDQFLVKADVALIRQISGYYEMGDDVVNTSIGVQYFPLDVAMIGADVGYLTGELGDDSSDQAETLRLTVEGAYQVSAMPIALFANVTSINDESWLGSDADGVLSASVGARWAFGGETLKQQAARLNQVSDLSAVSWIRLDGW